MGFSVVRIIAAIMLVWALDRHPYSYYTLLRFVVCGVSAYGVYFAIELNKQGWAWILGIVAILFNPFVPVYLDRSTWAIIDLGVAGLLFTSLLLLRPAKWT